jgi:hypothetical protein
MEKIKDFKVKCAILHQLHMMMFMSINPNETIDNFKACGGRRWWKILIIYNLVFFGEDIFGLIIANLVSKGSPFQVWHNLKYAMDTCSFFTHIRIHHQLKVCCACPCKALDGLVSLGPTFKSRHVS